MQNRFAILTFPTIGKRSPPCHASRLRLLFALLLLAFLIAEVYLVAYVHRTKAKVADLCRRAEAAAMQR